MLAIPTEGHKQLPKYFMKPHTVCGTEDNCLKRDFQDFCDFQDWGTCDESHYYEQFDQSGIGVPSYNSSQPSESVGNRSSLLQKNRG